MVLFLLELVSIMSKIWWEGRQVPPFPLQVSAALQQATQSFRVQNCCWEEAWILEPSFGDIMGLFFFFCFFALPSKRAKASHWIVTGSFDFGSKSIQKNPDSKKNLRKKQIIPIDLGTIKCLQGNFFSKISLSDKDLYLGTLLQFFKVEKSHKMFQNEPKHKP